jgi:hypothetical protein
MDFGQYYDLESYLFDKVCNKFRKLGYLDAFDFFCIVIWKANRAKSKVAKTLLSSGAKSLDDAVKTLTSDIYRQSTAKDRLRVLWKARFRLPMASAILTVLYPHDFTVYDRRVCDILHDFHSLSDVSNFDRLWLGYQDFKGKVEKETPKKLTLRDKDRYLWGKSRYEQLKHDLDSGFIKDNSNTRQNKKID